MPSKLFINDCFDPQFPPAKNGGNTIYYVMVNKMIFV